MRFFCVCCVRTSSHSQWDKIATTTAVSMARHWCWWWWVGFGARRQRAKTRLFNWFPPTKLIQTRWYHSPIPSIFQSPSKTALALIRHLPATSSDWLSTQCHWLGVFCEFDDLFVFFFNYISLRCFWSCHNEWKSINIFKCATKSSFFFGYSPKEEETEKNWTVTFKWVMDIIIYIIRKKPLHFHDPWWRSISSSS